MTFGNSSRSSNVIYIYFIITYQLLPECFIWTMHISSSQKSCGVDFVIPILQMRTMRTGTFCCPAAFRSGPALEFGQTHSKGPWWLVSDSVLGYKWVTHGVSGVCKYRSWGTS